jgi:DNA (cytosine-5)-methyltransferase 1
MYRVLDLFSGIGGFSLGLERTGGFKTVAFCEIDPYCRKVLAKHWPGVPIYDDVRELTAERLQQDGIIADVLCGGFPCQDISVAGSSKGIDGPRSGLWREYARIIGEIRPQFVIVENTAALTGRGLGRVLGDLAEVGFDAEWHCIPAAAIGAPHLRDRLWLIATDANSNRLEGRLFGTEIARGSASLVGGDVWESIPEHPGHRSRNGVSAYVDRLRALGNAVVPQIPELIGRAILQAEGKVA